jgi:hypothetical protein
MAPQNAMPDHRAYDFPVPEISEEFAWFVRFTVLCTMLVISGLMVYISVRGLRQAHRLAKHDALPLLDGRSRLSLDQFFERFYAAKEYPRPIVAEVLLSFAAAAQVSPELLRPEDSFSELGLASMPACEDFTVKTAMLLRAAEQQLRTPLFSGKLVNLDDHIRAYVTVYRFTARRTTVNV